MEARTAGEARQIVGQVPSAREYRKLRKAEKGTARRYLMQVTGYGRAQIARLIREYGRTGELKPKRSPRRKFPTRYTRADIELVASVDSAHQGLSGAAVRRLLQRGLEVYGDAAYERLATISVSHIYNLRSTELSRRNAPCASRHKARRW